MKKAVMYGAGNIGRGFIGQLFSQSGYETVFIDINRTVIDRLNSDRSYPVYIARNGEYLQTTVENVRAVDGRDAEAAAGEIASADVMATAVGVNVLPHIAATLAAGIARRFAENARPLNIIICENLLDADQYLSQLVRSRLTPPQAAYLEQSVGFVEASVGRMVPATPEELAARNPLTVCAEEYCELPVDRDAFKGEIPAVDHMRHAAPFAAYIQRKLFMHNMSHALTAYLGHLAGLVYIHEAIGRPLIRDCAHGALSEAARALAAEHGIEAAPLQEHAEDLLARYQNVLLGDTVARVGKDPVRKLSENDRLCGAFKLCFKHGVKPEHIAVGIAAGLRFSAAGDGAAEEVSSFAKAEGVPAALKKYCAITDAGSVKMITQRYESLGDIEFFKL